MWEYIRKYDVPVNGLHNRSFPSIGCGPCTRAVKPGEDVRAGRWWWESPETKECGLHVQAQGKTATARESKGDGGGSKAGKLISRFLRGVSWFLEPTFE